MSYVIPAAILKLKRSAAGTGPDHRTLYAQAAARKPTTNIDPSKTVATRK